MAWQQELIEVHMNKKLFTAMAVFFIGTGSGQIMFAQDAGNSDADGNNNDFDEVIVTATKSVTSISDVAVAA